jgi:hypothetical protein
LSLLADPSCFPSGRKIRKHIAPPADGSSLWFQIRIILPDGSEVILNSGSSLAYDIKEFGVKNGKYI